MQTLYHDGGYSSMGFADETLEVVGRADLTIRSRLRVEFWQRLRAKSASLSINQRRRTRLRSRSPTSIPRRPALTVIITSEMIVD
jgi:hypothetical protein